jgi:hypothetical protein
MYKSFFDFSLKEYNEYNFKKVISNDEDKKGEKKYVVHQ